jgi:hypothetical protein
MRPTNDLRSRARRVWRPLLAASIVLFASDAFAQYVLRQTSAGTGVSNVMTPCLALSSSVGEAVADSSSSGTFHLSSGFWGARPSTPRNGIFRDGFEDCSP